MTTGSAVLNMARQLGSAVGVALLVSLLASVHPDTLDLFRRGGSSSWSRGWRPPRRSS